MKTLTSDIVEFFRSKPEGSQFSVVQIENALVKDETGLCGALLKLVQQGELSRAFDWVEGLYKYKHEGNGVRVIQYRK